MNLFETTCSKLVEDKMRYQALLRRFEQLKAGFKRLAEERNSPVPGIKYEEKEGALLVSFLDRRIRGSMRYRRPKGVVHVEDVSTAGQPPASINIPFDEDGITDQPGGIDGGNLSLASPGANVTSRFSIDAALERDS